MSESDKTVAEQANACLRSHIECVVSYAQEAYQQHPTASGIKEAYGRLMYAKEDTHRQFPSLDAAINPVHSMLVNDLLVASDKVGDRFVTELLEADPVRREYQERNDSQDIWRILLPDEKEEEKTADENIPEEA